MKIVYRMELVTESLRRAAFLSRYPKRNWNAKTLLEDIVC
jgi:hypothetical protein